jgi:hypothetical protein
MDRLKRWHRRLVIAYIGFVASFGSSCAMAATGVAHDTVLASFALAALVLPAINLFVSARVLRAHPDRKASHGLRAPPRDAREPSPPA